MVADLRQELNVSVKLKCLEDGEIVFAVDWTYLVAGLSATELIGRTSQVAAIPL